MLYKCLGDVFFFFFLILYVTQDPPPLPRVIHMGLVNMSFLVCARLLSKFPHNQVRGVRHPELSSDFNAHAKACCITVSP